MSRSRRERPAVPWRASPPVQDVGAQPALPLDGSLARRAAEAIARATVVGWYDPSVAPAIERAIGAELVIAPPRITGQSDHLRSEIEAWERACGHARLLQRLRIDGAPVFIVVEQLVGDAGYSHRGLLRLVLRLDPRILKRFAEAL